MDDLADEVLMERVQRGESQLLGLLARRYERSLFALSMRMLRQREAAEDAFQDTLLKVFQSRSSYRPGSSFRPWVYRICLNVCRDQLRKQQRRPQAELKEDPVDQRAGVAEEVEKARLARVVAAAVGAMPEKQRDVFLLSFYEQLPYPEIAEILDIPVGTVKSRMFHATRWLSEKLSENRNAY